MRDLLNQARVVTEHTNMDGDRVRRDPRCEMWEIKDPGKPPEWGECGKPATKPIDSHGNRIYWCQEHAQHVLDQDAEVAAKEIGPRVGAWSPVHGQVQAHVGPDTQISGYFDPSESHTSAWLDVGERDGMKVTLFMADRPTLDRLMEVASEMRRRWATELRP